MGKFRKPSFFRLLANERGETSGEGGEGDGNGAGGDGVQQLTELQGKFESLSGEMESLKEANQDLEQRLKDADEELLSDNYLSWKESQGRSGGTHSSDGNGKNVPDDIDLDRASNREIAQWIQKNYKGDLKAAMDDIRKDGEATKKQIGLIAAQFDVALAEIRHNGSDGKPSFSENRKEIFKIAKENPSWDAEKCYRQFVLQSKEKIDLEAAEKKKRAEEEAKAATERAGVPSSTTQGKAPSKEEAADLAYRKAFGSAE